MPTLAGQDLPFYLLAGHNLLRIKSFILLARSLHGENAR